MNDSCRWVYRAAAESLGLFISSFARPCVLGVAYRPNGELYIPNAADADYKYVYKSIIIIMNYHDICTYWVLGGLIYRCLEFELSIHFRKMNEYNVIFIMYSIS